MHAYFAFGLHIRSELVLPELTPGPIDAEPDVVVRLGAVPDSLPGARHRMDALEIGTNEVLFRVAGVAQFHMLAGKEMIVAPYEGATEPSVRSYLLGSAFGILCHERGLLPLHANAIHVNGSVVAFAGHSGAGKSTLASYFHGKGYEVLSDDICVVSFPPGGPPLAWPGIPRLRMWRDTVETMGYGVETLERSHGEREKFHLPLQIADPLKGLPLSRIYVLDPKAPGSAVTRFSTVAAMQTVMIQTYRAGYLNLSGGTGARFASNATLIRNVAVFRTPWVQDFAALPERADQLERHFLSDLAEAPCPA